MIERKKWICPKCFTINEDHKDYTLFPRCNECETRFLWDDISNSLDRSIHISEWAASLGYENNLMKYCGDEPIISPIHPGLMFNAKQNTGGESMCFYFDMPFCNFTDYEGDAAPRSNFKYITETFNPRGNVLPPYATGVLEPHGIHHLYFNVSLATDRQIGALERLLVLLTDQYWIDEDAYEFEELDMHDNYVKGVIYPELKRLLPEIPGEDVEEIAREMLYEVQYWVTSANQVEFERDIDWMVYEVEHAYQHLDAAIDGKPLPRG